MSTDEITPAQVRFSAMNLLAKREHSAKELQVKLVQRFANTAMVNEVVAQLARDNLQSDDRYTEAFIIMRARQGKGPIRIALELKERGVASNLINNFLDAADADWFELAMVEKRKRFGNEIALDIKEKSRQARFLQYRGFTHAQVEAALK